LKYFSLFALPPETMKGESNLLKALSRITKDQPMFIKEAIIRETRKW